MKTILSSIAIISFSLPAIAQGCSDAGFCTIGAIKQNPDDTNLTRNSITLSWANGLGDDGVFVSTPAIQYDLRVAHELAFQLKATGNYASGTLGTAAGAGDIYINATKAVKAGKHGSVAFTVGGKIPLSNSNLTANGRPLPMQYQSSLGTYDAIAGVTYTYKKWRLSAAYQQPLSGTNQNAFRYSAWATSDVLAYPESNKLRRQADALLKAGYMVRAGNRWSFTPGLLTVYHIGEDKYYNALIAGERALVGSNGLTLNLTLNVQYKTRNWNFGLLAGRPLVVRDIRPDGLTRSIVVAPELSYNF